MSGCDAATDLRRRVDRTLDYLNEIAKVTQSESTARVVLACIKSLETPIEPVGGKVRTL